MARARVSIRRESGVYALRADEFGDALELCAVDPVGSVLAASQILPGLSRGVPVGCEVLGYWVRGRLSAVCWSGANLVPVHCDSRAAIAFAHHVRRQGRRCSSIVGDSVTVTEMWESLEDAWPSPREIRARQRSLATLKPGQVEPDPMVRLSRADEFDLVYPACVAMFTEEVGYSPLSQGGGPGYTKRVNSLIAAGRSFVRIAETARGDEVVFKAEIGATALGVAQIQGVWVHPEFRGRGLSAAGLSTVVNHTRARIASTVSLYVNDFNAVALATYRRVGFTQVGSFSTILF